MTSAAASASNPNGPVTYAAAIASNRKAQRTCVVSEVTCLFGRVTSALRRATKRRREWDSRGLKSEQRVQKGREFRKTDDQRAPNFRKTAFSRDKSLIRIWILIRRISRLQAHQSRLHRPVCPRESRAGAEVSPTWSARSPTRARRSPIRVEGSPTCTGVSPLQTEASSTRIPWSPVLCRESLAVAADKHARARG